MFCNIHMGPLKGVTTLLISANFLCVICASSMLRPDLHRYEEVQPVFSPLETDVSDSGQNYNVMRLSFRAFGDDVEVVLHRTLDDSPHSDSDSDSRMYELQNATTTALGYKNSDSQFEGFVENGEVIYYIERTATFSGKSIVYRSTDVVMRNLTSSADESLNATELDQRYDAEFFESEPEVLQNIDSSSVDTGESESDFYECRVRVVGDRDLRNYKGEDYRRYLTLHVKATDIAFRRTNFGPKKIRLVVPEETDWDDDYSSNRTNSNLSELLEDFREYNSRRNNSMKNLCATVLFSHRLYQGIQNGIGYYGRICSRNNNNVAVIRTLDAHGNARSLDATIRTFMHEMGHLFGSEHDPVDDRSCNPESDVGTYIMGRTQTNGRRNFRQYSPCSIRNIAAFLSNSRHLIGCLKPMRPVCGNGIREKGEECDCGNVDTCAFLDKCCVPANRLKSNESHLGCRYRGHHNRACSFREDKCCTENCSIAGSGTECEISNDGCVTQVCDGNSKDCTKYKKIVPNGRKCSAFRNDSCNYGYCGKSFCQEAGYLHCNCSGENACRVCCSAPGGSCVPANELGAFNGEDVFVSYGTECACNDTSCSPAVQNFSSETLLLFNPIDDFTVGHGIRNVSNKPRQIITAKSSLYWAFNGFAVAFMLIAIIGIYIYSRRRRRRTFRANLDHRGPFNIAARRFSEPAKSVTLDEYLAH